MTDEFGLEEFQADQGLEQFEVEDEAVEFAEDLEGFASCFPNWDLHPPKAK